MTVAAVIATSASTAPGCADAGPQATDALTGQRVGARSAGAAEQTVFAVLQPSPDPVEQAPHAA
ncbi:MAG: hypothetical protein ABI080_15960 [Candidatus Binatia bacterium]